MPIEWIRRKEACRQGKVWLDAGLQAVPVSVNISAVEFRNKGFLESVAQVLTESGLPSADRRGICAPAAQWAY